MSYKGLVCLLLGSLAWGQAAKPATNPNAQKPAMTEGKMSASAEKTPEASMKAADPAKVAPDAAVITLTGVCASSTADKADCKTVVTKQDFEKLINAVAPNMPPAARRQLAARYATGLTMATEAEKQGLDKGPNFEEMMKVSRVQVLAQELQKSLQEKASQISDKDIEDYYNNDKQGFEEASVQRLFIPRSKQLEPAKEGASEADMQKQQDEAQAAMKTEAESLQKRAAAGEDFNKLQQDAFDAAGMKAKAPNTTMPKVRRSTLPATHQSVFDLKAGEVSPVISDASGYFIYKMGEKTTIPLDQAKDEIRNSLRAQRMQDAMQKIQAEAQPKLNEEYFGPDTGEGEMPGMSVHTLPKPMPKSKPETPKSK